jgi:hypothetical protein
VRKFASDDKRWWSVLPDGTSALRRYGSRPDRRMLHVADAIDDDGATRLLAAGSPARQACGTGQEQCPGYSEIPGLDPAARSECERTNWVAQGAIAVPDRTLKEEHRDERQDLRPHRSAVVCGSMPAACQGNWQSSRAKRSGPLPAAKAKGRALAQPPAATTTTPVIIRVHQTRPDRRH